MPDEHQNWTEVEFDALLEAARKGREPAIEELFRRFYPQVQSMAHARLAADVRVGRPWLDARFSTGDVVQDVFRSLLRDLRAFRGSTEEAFCGYLAMVVKNRLVDAIRFHQADQRDGRRTADGALESERPAQGQSPGTELAWIERIRAFQEALERFDEREQLLLRGRLEHDASFQDLAEQLGYSSRSAAQRVFYRAQAELTIFLRKKGGGEGPER